MKCKIPEISWHNRDPVLSVDVQMQSNLAGIYRLASGGTDAHVLIWYVRFTCDEDIQLDLAADLNRHQRAVNVVKWSPNGELLASGDDESVIFIWKQKSETEPVNVLDETSEQDKEVWLTMKVLRGHMEDVYDVSWSPNSQFLVSGSVDNSAIIWDVHKGKSMTILNEHKGFVQGVAWDPRNQHIATLSTDRNLRIYDVQTKRVLHRISKGALPVPEGHELHNKRVRYFHDDTLQTFFRRMCYTPDGKLLLTPAGVTDYDGATELMHTAYVFNCQSLRQPAIMLPCPEQYAVAMRCCPLLFKLRPFNAECNAPVVPLPYRMIFAIATQCSVYFYDTQQRQPFAVISNIHYTRLTDATWSSDGRIVVVSSTDGFCSLITFEPGELGEEYEGAQAVLDAVLNSDTVNGALAKKSSKKQKENCVQKPLPSTEIETSAVAFTVAAAAHEPLAEKTKEQTQPIATSIAFRRKANSKDGRAQGEPEEGNDGVTDRKADQKEDKAATLIATHKKSDITKEPSVGEAASAGIEKINEGKPATPIAIRRQSSTSSTEQTNASAPEPTPAEKKAAMAIAVKRKSDMKAESPVLKQLKIGEKPPTPIAFRRKLAMLQPQTKDVVATVVLDSDDNDDDNNDNVGVLTGKQTNQSIMLPKEQKSNDAMKSATPSRSQKSEAVNPLSAALPQSSGIVVKALPVDAVIDKEILGSDEKFDSPEKKCRPVTPISVRRHPRTPNSASHTPTTLTSYFAKVDANHSPLSSLAQSEKSPCPSSKRATPIAIRRTPRVLTPSATVPSKLVDTNIAVEEALDAWPVPLESPVKTAHAKSSPAKPKRASICTATAAAAPTASSTAAMPSLPHCDLTTERTEDMRLVYEDTVEEDQGQPAKTTVVEQMPTPDLPCPVVPANECVGSQQITNNNNTVNDKTSVNTPSKKPRRVALKTISTPKSKSKKIIE